MCIALLIRTLNSNYMYHKFVSKLALHHLGVKTFFLVVFWGCVLFFGVACCFSGLRVVFWGCVLLLGVAWGWVGLRGVAKKTTTRNPKGFRVVPHLYFKVIATDPS